MAELNPPQSGDDRGTSAADIDFKDYLLSGPRSDELITDRPTDRGREVDLSGVTFVEDRYQSWSV